MRESDHLYADHVQNFRKLLPILNDYQATHVSKFGTPFAGVSMGAEQSQLTQFLDDSRAKQNYISFFVNKKEYNVKTDGFDPEFEPNYVLVDFLRNKIGLTGTKYMCREGGCGACTVMVKSLHPKSGQPVIRSVNSCLLPLYACDGLEITTIEDLGDSKKGYHAIQDRLVKFGGTQCGFCSPGFVMNMYSYSLVNPQFTGGNVEYSLDGNICRCTGYRPILDSFKSLAKNTTEDLRQKCIDIEDCYKCPLSPIHARDESEEKKLSLEIINPPRNLHLRSSATENEWIKVTSLSNLFDLLHNLKYVQKKYRLVAGNTGIGVYKNDGPYMAFVEINDVPELHELSIDKYGMVLGGGTSLTTTIDQFNDAAKVEGFVYASEFSKHLRRLGSLTVRNSATLAGNLMLKHDHPEFPSDIFTLFESVGATVRIGSSLSLYKKYTLLEFLELDMAGKVILSVHLPTYGPNYVFRCFKIARRYQNCIAHVNAAFLVNVDRKANYNILSKPSLCFGGISSTFVHSPATEELLTGNQLNASTLRSALQTLEREVIPDENPLEPSPDYRRGLAVSMLYKFILGIRRDTVQPRLKTGADDVDRGLNTGVQVFDTDKSKWPLYKPIPKLESFPQVSGEAEFIDDIQHSLDELFGVFVLTNVANATISNVDASRALSIPGVVAFVSAKDVPGENSFTVFGSQKEEIFITSKVLYAGQAVGLIVAKTRNAAYEARDQVIVKYENVKKPILDIKDSVKKMKESNTKVEADLAYPCRGITSDIASRYMKNIHEKKSSKIQTDLGKVEGNLRTVKGEFITRGQYHLHMETQICLCVPKEDGMDVYAASQYIDQAQSAIAKCLNIPNNSINMVVRRIGGGFGGKATKGNYVATAAAVACFVTNKPVRIGLDLETNMRMIGKREPYLTKYEASVDDTGKIHKLSADVYCDSGAVANDASSLFATVCMQSCYHAESWDITPKVALTDTASNTYCRSPGTAQGVAAIEHIMEHIAATVKRDPLDVREVNFIQKGDPLIGIPGAKLNTSNPLPGILQQLKNTSDYAPRKEFVESHNKANRWRKRGLSIVPLRYSVYYADLRLPTFISVYHGDGTVSVSHGGIEMGQGINTKVAQIVSYTLGIPLENVRIKPTNNLISPNAAFSGASVTSELVCHSAREACLKLLDKMQPVKEQLGGNPTWQQLIAVCHTKGLLLTSQHQDLPSDIIAYDVWAAGLVELEVDVLTGDYRLIRVDIAEDAGNSLSPLLDIGQIEGAFVMGLGWLLTENLMYDKETGELLTNNTNTYKPMLSADIPEDFRVTMLRNTPNPFGVMSSKATAEPPLNMSVAVMFALRKAIDSARQDVGNFEWYPMDAPVSREDVRRLALTSTEQFTI